MNSCARRNNRVFPIFTPQRCRLLYTNCSHNEREKAAALCVSVGVCACKHVTPGCVVGDAGKDSQWLKGCSVPGCGRRFEGSDLRSVGNSRPVSWQTLAPPTSRRSPREKQQSTVWSKMHHSYNWIIKGSFIHITLYNSFSIQKKRKKNRQFKDINLNNIELQK